MMALGRMFVQMWRHRTMVYGLVRRDLRSRYAGSALGLVWTLLHPLLLLVVYLVVFSLILRVKFTETGGSGEFALYLLAGLLPWLAFQEGVTKAAASLVEHASLVKGVRFPPVVLVASSILPSIANLLIFISIFLLALLVIGRLSWFGLAFIPLLIVLQVALTLGPGLVFASLYTFLRDTMPVLQVVLMVWFYLSPIIYPISYVPLWLGTLVAWNPITSLVTAYRAVLVEGMAPSGMDLIVVFTWTAVMVLIGTLVFTRVEQGFADVL
jgi:ABC-type polysaccharide/polyol phosphate export permease